jgi:hypothetical protein
VFSARSVQNWHKEDFSWEELVEFRDSSLPGYELGSSGIELSWELQNNVKNTSCVIRSDSETVINPLPG